MFGPLRTGGNGGMGRREFVGALGASPFIPSLDHFPSIDRILLETPVGTRSPLSRSDVYPSGFTIGADQQSPLVLAWGANTLFRHELGFDELSRRQIVEGILSTHPDTFWSTRIIGFDGPPREGYFAPDARAQVYFAREYGFETVVGRMGELGTHRANDWYNGLDTDEKWRWPDGTIVEEQVETAVTRPDGTPISFEDRGPGEDFTFEPSKHAQPIRDFFAMTAIDVVDSGTSGLWIDGGTNWGYRDFSEWAKIAFVDHLSTLDAARLANLGVDDPDSLDAVDEILDRTPLHGGDNPATDPLYREFVKRDYLAIRGFFEHVRNEVQATFPDVHEELILFANQTAFMDAPELVALTAAPLNFPGMEAQLTVPPDFIYEFVHKFGTAVNGYERPGFHMGTAVVRQSADEAIRQSGLDSETIQADLLRTQFAEQIANGSIGSVNLAGDYNEGDLDEVPDNWMRPDGTIPESLREVTAFAAANRELLRAGYFDHDVAVVLSIPTLMWNRAEEWGIENDDVIHSFAGVCKVVRETCRPYDVLLFGHPDLQDDSAMLDRFGSYRQVVLPAVECISDDQLGALRSFLEGGGEVICVDGQPTRTEDYEPRPTSELGVFDHVRVTSIDGSAGRDVWRGAGSGRAIAEALDRRPPQVELGGDPNCSVTVRTADEGPSRAVVQVVNYEFDLGEGMTDPLSDLAMTVRGLDGVATCRLYRPSEDPSDVEIHEADGAVHVTVPRIEQWAILVFGESLEAVRHPGDESAASDSIEAAARAIDDAEREGRLVDLPAAEVQFERAEIAHATGAYRYAERSANQARETADAAIEAPRIGVDVAHGQPESAFGLDDLRAFQTSLDDVEFLELTDWTAETVDSLDAVLIPPADQNDAERAGLREGLDGFSEGELELLTSFVESEGTVLLFGASNLWGGWKPVSEAFDVTFEDVPIVGTGADEGIVQANRAHRFYPTETAPYVLPRWGAAFSLPDDATVLYRFADSHRVDGPNLRDSYFAGAPATALFRHGDGAVFVHASGDNLVTFHDVNEPTPMFLSTVTRTLGRVAALPELAESNGGASESTDTSRDPESDQLGAESPGFGVISALAGVLGAGYLLQRQRGDDRSK